MNESIHGILQNDSYKIRNLRDFWFYFNKCSCDAGISSIDNIMSKPSCDGGIYNLFDINGVGIYFDPHGKHICQLEQSKALLKNDLFLMSKLSNDIYTTYNVTYKQLSSQLIINILDALKTGTMAYEEKYDYAISNHNHDKLYSRVNFTVNPKYQRENDISTIGQLMISTDILTGDGYGKYDSIYHNPKYNQPIISSYDINIPKIVIPLPPKPMIGTLRFIGIQTIQSLIDSNMLCIDTMNINPYDSNNKIRNDYDGWVFPNGSLIQNINNQLSDAYSYYGENNYIKIPCLSNFFKCNSNTEEIRKENYNNCLKSHNHLLEYAKFEGDLTLESCYIGYSYGELWTETDLAKAGCPWEEDNSIGFQYLSCIIKMETTKCPSFNFNQNTGTNNIETYPTHNIIPIMIYIGGETREYYESLYDKYHKTT